MSRKEIICIWLRRRDLIYGRRGMELTDEELDGVAGGAIPFPKRPDDGVLHSKSTRK